MKIKLFTLLALFLTGTFAEAKPRLLHSETPVVRNAVQYRKISEHFFFNQSEMTYNYLLDPANKPVKQKWGDFELGLRHGRIQNGSWCMWNFFSCIMPDKSSLTDQCPAEKVCLMSTKNGVHAEIVWPGLTLKLIQLNNAQEWIFMEVTVKETPAILRLRAWPGGAKWKAAGGGERRLMTPGDDVKIPEKKLTFSGSSGGLALYNRNYSEKNGNFLVFEPEKYKEITASANNMVMLDFVPKNGEKVFHFALGYFLNEDPQEACSRSLKERLPNIAGMLKEIQWTPDADFSVFYSNVEVIEKIIAAGTLSEREKNSFLAELAQCKKRFKKAEENRDIPGAYHEVEVSGDIRSRIGQAAVRAFR